MPMISQCINKAISNRHVRRQLPNPLSIRTFSKKYESGRCGSWFPFLYMRQLHQHYTNQSFRLCPASPTELSELVLNISRRLPHVYIGSLSYL